MVRNYVRKTNRQQWDKRHMIDAISAISKGEVSVNSAATKYSIPKSTLVRYYQKAQTNGINLEDFKLGSFRTTFTEEQENKLKQYIKDVNLSLCELTSLELRRIAFQYAEANGISHNFNKKTKLAGYDWYRNFMKRNEITVKSDSEQSTYVLGGLNVTYSIDIFFSLLSDLQQFYKFPPNRIYNVHDRGVISIPNLTSQMFSATDKAIPIVNFLTVITCCNATGNFIPPLMVYPSKEDNPDFVKGCPPGTKIVCHPSGCIQQDTFFPTWFNHFLNYAQPKKEDPILLLLDGRGMYMKNIQFVQQAKEQNVHILSIPVTLSNKLYPLEVNFMPELKKCYCEEQDKWNTENKGKVIDLKCIGTIFNSAYTKAIVPNNIINGFKEGGIYPLNRYVLADKDNTPSVTPSINESSTSISFSTDTNSGESSSSAQTKNCNISIKAPSDINNSLVKTEDIKYFLFMEDQEESNSEILVETVKEDGHFETIYQEEAFEYCD